MASSFTGFRLRQLRCAKARHGRVTRAPVSCIGRRIQRERHALFCLSMVWVMSAEEALASGRRDWLGIACSGACVVHCSAPLLLALTGSSLAGLAIFRDETLHRALLILVPLVALWSLGPSLRAHHRSTPLALAGLGVTLLAGAVLLGEDLEKPFSIVGGLFMIVAHAHNRGLLRRSLPARPSEAAL